jgi:hypothetical protein
MSIHLGHLIYPDHQVLCTRGQCYTTENNNSDNFVNRKHEHFLKIYYLNVCGLKSKLKFQEITDGWWWRQMRWWMIER